MQDFDCIAVKEDTIQGIFSDQIFSYYEYSVVAKNQSKELTEEIERFLLENDCKLQLVYTGFIIDLDDYENPIGQYLEELFIQLNPTLFIKRNVFFMNQYFSNDVSLSSFSVMTKYQKKSRCFQDMKNILYGKDLIDLKLKLKNMIIILKFMLKNKE